MAIWQAKLVTDAINKFPDDLTRQNEHFLELIDTHIAPWFDIAVMMDGMRRDERDRLAKAGTDATAPDNPMKSLAVAASLDPQVWRTFWRVMNLLAPPTELMTPDFMERVVAAAAKIEPGIADNSASLPERDQMLKTAQGILAH